MNKEQGILDYDRNDTLRYSKFLVPCSKFILLIPDYIISYSSAQHCSLLVCMASLPEGTW